MAEDKRLREVLMKAIPPSGPKPPAVIEPFDIEAAIERARNQAMEPYQHPPVHPMDYEHARVALGLPRDHWLTMAEFYDGLYKWAETDHG